MPVPKPRGEEKQDAFISRCMSTLADTDPGRPSEQRLAMCFSTFRQARGIKESKVKKRIKEAVSNRSWAAVDKSKLPASSYLLVKDRGKKATWKLPVYEGAGSIGADGMYSGRGPINLGALRAASAAIAGARTGQAMSIPGDVRAKLTRLLKQHKIGLFAEQVGPVGESKIEESKKVRDITIPVSFKEAAFDKERMTIKNVVLLSKHSANNREYTDECLAGALPFFEGVKSYIDHKKGKEGRSVRDLTGSYGNARIEDGKVKADWNLVKDPITEKIMDMAERMPGLAGNSISASGRVRRVDGKDMVEELTGVASVDLVTEPATTKSLYEDVDEKGNDNKGGDKMEWGEVTSVLVQAKRNDVYEDIFAVGAQSKDEEIGKITEERDGLKKENDGLKGAETARVAGKALDEKIDKLLGESELPDEAKTETFKETLKAVREVKDGDKVVKTVDEQLTTLIADRVEVVGETVAKPAGGVVNMGGGKKLDEKKDGIVKKEEDGVKGLVEAVRPSGGMSTVEEEI